MHSTSVNRIVRSKVSSDSNWRELLLDKGELVIGDEALVRRPEFSAVLDLGELWFEMTGLPFVFAVWQSVQSQVPEATRSLLLRAAELSSARMRIDYQTYLPDPLPRDVRGQPINLGAYWRAIQYQFTPAHLDGLLLYFNLYLELLKQTQKLHIAERVAKLEDQWRSGT